MWQQSFLVASDPRSASFEAYTYYLEGCVLQLQAQINQSQSYTQQFEYRMQQLNAQIQDLNAKNMQLSADNRGHVDRSKASKAAFRTISDELEMKLVENHRLADSLKSMSQEQEILKGQMTLAQLELDRYVAQLVQQSGDAATKYAALKVEYAALKTVYEETKTQQTSLCAELHRIDKLLEDVINTRSELIIDQAKRKAAEAEVKELTDQLRDTQDEACEIAAEKNELYNQLGDTQSYACRLVADNDELRRQLKAAEAKAEDREQRLVEMQEDGAGTASVFQALPLNCQNIMFKPTGPRGFQARLSGSENGAVAIQKTQGNDSLRKSSPAAFWGTGRNCVGSNKEMSFSKKHSC